MKSFLTNIIMGWLSSAQDIEIYFWNSRFVLEFLKKIVREYQTSTEEVKPASESFLSNLFGRSKTKKSSLVVNVVNSPLLRSKSIKKNDLTEFVQAMQELLQKNVSFALNAFLRKLETKGISTAEAMAYIKDWDIYEAILFDEAYENPDYICSMIYCLWSIIQM